MKHALPRTLSVMCVVATVVATAACGGSSDDDAAAGGPLTLYGKTVTADAALRDSLPDAVKQKGELVVGTDANGPPRTFVDENGDIAGVMPDLMKAVGAKLGVKVKLEKVSFDAEVPGVQSGRFISSSGTGDFPARRAVLDMVDYMKAGYLYLVAAGNPKNVADDFPSQCGLRVGVLKGTTQETLVPALSKKCVAAGKPAVQMQSFSNVLLEVPLSAGRIDVAWENTSTGFKVSQDEPDKFAVAGSPVFAAYLAFGVKKDNTGYRDVLQKTLTSLAADGTYAAILAHWKQSDLAMDKMSVNSDVRS